jgi:hypothetical protein
MTSTLPIPGLHHNVPYEEYAQWDAINFSRLKSIRKTASKCRWEMDHPKDMTDAMKNGQALHVATLEPGRFNGMFHICPPADGRTSAGKEILAHHSQLAKDARKIMIREGLKDDEGKIEAIAAYRGMAAAIHKCKTAKLLLHGQGQNEVSGLWFDDETGLWCKFRTDRIVDSLEYIVEIKSTRDASEWSFGKDCASMDYHAQAASYIYGYKKITGKKYGHAIIAVESEQPHDVAFHYLDDADLQTGLVTYRGWLNRYSECRKSNEWPGYPDKLQRLSLPKWAND